MSNSKLTHLDEAGHASMVNVGMKPDTERCATATGKVRMEAATLDAIMEGSLPKGDVFAVARIAGIQAAKQCFNLIHFKGNTSLILMPVTSNKTNPKCSRPGTTKLTFVKNYFRF